MKKNVVFTDIKSEVKLNLSKCTDGWFWTSISLNPYRGCQHFCQYCDGIAHYYRISNFGTHIRVKENFPTDFSQALRKLGYRSKHDLKQLSLVNLLENKKNNKESYQEEQPKYIFAVGGGVTDAYQPIESKKMITKKLLKILIDYEFPAFILTKNTLVERDIDLIGELNDRCYASINFSITTTDPKHRLLLEPYTSSSSRRFEVLRNFREQGIPGGVSMMPLAPFISDTSDNLIKLLQMAEESKAEYSLIAGLTLKPGNRELFLKLIKEKFPALLEKYLKIYPKNNTFGIPKFSNNVKLDNITAIGHELCKKFRIMPRIPRFIPEGHIKANLEVVEHIHYLIYLLGIVRNVKTRFELQNWQSLSCIIESNLNLDVSTLSAEERRIRLPGSEELHKVIDEFLLTGSSSLKKKWD